ncbi:MAG: response regulator, partial [Deltaproteobacteria bacterium]|nr:response regulator [Deltaproteobacteria bacterium]
QPQLVEFRTLVGESLKLLRSALPTTIRFQINLENGVGYVLGDPTQLHQIMLNLCTNAAHAMRGRTGTLSVSLERQELDPTADGQNVGRPSGPCFCLTVTDEGRGMSSETLSHIFLPFFTTKETGEGTGLVDDEIDILGALKEGLTYNGYTVVAYLDPEKALNDFLQRPTAFDLILTDFTMPGLTGLQLGAAIQDQSPNLPMLLMTGNTGQLSVTQCHELGFRDLIPKPVGIQQILQILQRELKERP